MALLLRWQKRPDLFVRECLGVRPDPWQDAVLLALVQRKRVTVAACHGPGKDAVASWAVLWVMTCFPDPKVPCTAPTGHQLYDLLWAELAKWMTKMPPYYKALFELKKDRLERKTRPDTWFAAARTARKENSEALQGFHADTILVVCDEASGIPAEIFEVLEGAMTGPNAMMLLIGNPTRTTGYFYDSHHSDRDRWSAHRVLARNAVDPLTFVPPPGTWLSPRISQEYVDAMARKYGVDSNVYRVRVLGQFPKSEDDQVVPFEWLEEARVRHLPPDFTPAHDLVLGLDVARFGSDDSALVARLGPLILDAWTWHGHDEDATVGKVLVHTESLVKKGLRPRRIFVDGIGVGKGVVERLRRSEKMRKLGVAVVSVHVGEASPDDECELMRDALWWRARKLFDPKIGGYSDGTKPVISREISIDLTDRLVGELSGPKFSYTKRQRIKVESKDDMRDRGLASPDLADALLLTLYHEVKAAPQKSELERAFPKPKIGANTNWKVM